MIQTLTMTSGLGLTDREWFLLIIGMVVYAVLFVVTVQNSRRKMMVMHEKIRTLQEAQQSQSTQSIAQNEAKIAELETLLKKLGDENSLLRLELEEKKATLDYHNKVYSGDYLMKIGVKVTSASDLVSHIIEITKE